VDTHDMPWRLGCVLARVNNQWMRPIADIGTIPRHRATATGIVEKD
jgi:hypothetical protein